jgi:hypothetical protein
MLSNGNTIPVPPGPAPPEARLVVNSQYFYMHGGRPALCLQFSNVRCRNQPADAYGLLRCAGDWHGTIHYTDWNRGRFHKFRPGGGLRDSLQLMFRYKMDTPFLVRRHLFWDSLKFGWTDGIVLMTEQPVSNEVFEWFMTPKQAPDPRTDVENLSCHDDEVWRRNIEIFELQVVN